MLARVLAWVVDIHHPNYAYSFQLGKDGRRLPYQDRAKSRFLHERASCSQHSFISSICQHNAHWECKCARTDLSNMRTEDLELFFHHRSSLREESRRGFALACSPLRSPPGGWFNCPPGPFSPYSVHTQSRTSGMSSRWV